MKILLWIFLTFPLCFAQEAQEAQEADVDGSSENNVLIVGIKEAEPFSFKNSSDEWEGISVELWKGIAEELELEYTFEEATLADMLSGVAEEKFDAAVGALTITAKREESLDFTHPFYATGLSIAVRDESVGISQMLRSFFSREFILAISVLVLCLFVAGFLVWLFERHENEEFKGLEGFGSSFWWSAVTMTTVGYGDKTPRTFGGRAVALIWMFTSLIIISGIIAMIASAFTVERLQTKINDPGDLPNVQVATVLGSSSEEYLLEKQISYNSYESLLSTLTALDKGEVDAVVYDQPLLKFQIHSNSEFEGLTVLPHIFDFQQYALALEVDSDLREPINRTLVEMISSENWEDLLLSYFGE